jgi:hypothetical protein
MPIEAEPVARVSLDLIPSERCDPSYAEQVDVQGSVRVSDLPGGHDHSHGGVHVGKPFDEIDQALPGGLVAELVEPVHDHYRPSVEQQVLHCVPRCADVVRVGGHAFDERRQRPPLGPDQFHQVTREEQERDTALETGDRVLGDVIRELGGEGRLARPWIPDDDDPLTAAKHLGDRLPLVPLGLLDGEHGIDMKPRIFDGRSVAQMRQPHLRPHPLNLRPQSGREPVHLRDRADPLQQVAGTDRGRRVVRCDRGQDRGRYRAGDLRKDARPGRLGRDREQLNGQIRPGDQLLVREADALCQRPAHAVAQLGHHALGPAAYVPAHHLQCEMVELGGGQEGLEAGCLRGSQTVHEGLERLTGHQRPQLGQEPPALALVQRPAADVGSRPCARLREHRLDREHGANASEECPPTTVVRLLRVGV